MVFAYIEKDDGASSRGGELSYVLIQFFDDGEDEDYLVQYECNDLASLIRQSPTKIPRIELTIDEELDNHETSRPEYLALLASILNKATRLELNGTLGGDAAFACFRECMQQQNGLRELSIDSDGGDIPMSTHDVRLLCEGIAVSGSLERLYLDKNFSEPDVAGRALADALARNNSLTNLYLTIWNRSLEEGGTVIQDLFHSALDGKRTRKITITDLTRDLEDDDHRFLQISFDTMAEVLCTETCKLNKLNFEAIVPAARANSALSNEHIEDLRNTSVTHYSIQQSGLDCFRIMEVASLFKSLKVLELSNNEISDLSPLDPLLIGDGLTLETLDLYHNRITEQDAIQFFHRLPKMTCLKEVFLSSNPFIDVSHTTQWKDVLAEEAWKNRSLERISCVVRHDENDAALVKVHLALSLNRGGRRALELESPTPLPANLWPHVLQRAGQASYLSISHSDLHHSTLNSIRSDVVFWLLKEKILGSCSFGESKE